MNSVQRKESCFCRQKWYSWLVGSDRSDLFSEKSGGGAICWFASYLMWCGAHFRAPHHTTSFSKFNVRRSWLCKYCSYFYRILLADLFLPKLKSCSWFLITCVGTLRMSCRYSCLKFLLLILFIVLASGLDTSTPSQSSLSYEASVFINQELEITLAR